MDSTRSFFPKIWPGRCLISRFFLSTREPDVLAICLFYTFLLLLTRRIELYEISTWLKPRVHELKGKKNMTTEKRTQIFGNWKPLSAGKKMIAQRREQVST